MKKIGVLALLVILVSAGAAYAGEGASLSSLSPTLIIVVSVLVAVVSLATLRRVLRSSAYTSPIPRGSGSFDAVIALVGHKAAGKDEFCRILEKKGFVTRRISDAIRAEAKRRGIEDPPDSILQDLGNEGRAKNGSGFWASQLVTDLERDGIRLAIVNGVRNPGELDAIQAQAGEAFIAVGITAPYEVRLQRYVSRGQRGGALSPDEFHALDAKDRGVGQPDDGQQTDRCMAMVWPDNLYENGGSLGSYAAWVDEFLSRHGLGDG
jgi:dephospho-CoA kinase